MLFHVMWEFVDTSEEAQKRSLSVFSSGGLRTAPIQRGVLRLQRRDGGVALVEVDSAATLSRTIDPSNPWLRFTVTPIVPIEESSQIANEAVAFRDSVG